MKKRIIPDYKDIDKIFLVSPVGIRDYLIEEFLSFVSILGEIIENKKKNQKIIVVCESEKSEEETKCRILALNLRVSTWEVYCCKVLDIWIRDFFSCANIIEDGKLGTIKATYAPSYNSLSAVDDAAGTILSQKYFDNIYTLPMKLDGGNVISNSEYYFISEKLYTENFYLNKSTIDNFFDKNFEQKLITLPTEILDVVGHTDCILRFLDEKNILLPIYDAEYRVDNRYIMNIKKKLIENIGIEYNFIFIPSYLANEINEDNIFSAKGLYLNYFRFEDCLIFPSFKDLSDYETEIVRIIKKISPNLNIYFSPCDQISYWGGCLSCITNVKYKI